MTFRYLSARATAAVRRAIVYAIEHLESRRLLSTINWTNPTANNFVTLFGSQNAALATQIVNRAIDDWERVIVDFNYDDTGPNLNNTFNITISAGQLGSVRGQTSNFTRDDATDRKPSSATIIVDDNGGGSGWYFDPAVGTASAPDNDVQTLYMADSTSGGGSDFYRTVVHEIGHAMGLVDSEFLKIADHLFEVGPDPLGGTLLDVAGIPFDWTMTTAGGGHLWEGDGPGGVNRPEHPDVLLNDDRALPAGINRRQLISTDEANLLRDVYGYTVVLPNHINTFFVSLDSTTNVVVVDGNLTPGFPTGNLLIRRLGTAGHFQHGGIEEVVAEVEWNSLFVHSGPGNDVFLDDLAAGKSVTINLTASDDRVDVADQFDDVDSSILSNVTFNAGGGNDTIFFHDTLDNDGPDSWTLDGSDLTRFTRLFELNFFDAVEIYGSSHGDTYNILRSFGTVRIDPWSGNDVINIGGGDVDSNLGGAVSITSGLGSDTINFDDTLDGPGGDNWVITSTSITKGAVNPVAYGQDTEFVNINGSNQGETFNINSTLATLNIDGNAGNDRFNIGNGDLDNVRTVGLIGGDGDDTVDMNDSADTVADTYDLSSDRLTKSGAGTVFVEVVVNTTPAERTEHMILRANNFANPINVTSAYGLEIHAGGGDDVITHDNNNIATPTLIDGGAGFDDVLINSDNIGATSIYFNSSQDLSELRTTGNTDMAIAPGANATIEVRDGVTHNFGGPFGTPQSFWDINDNSMVIRETASAGNVAFYRMRIVGGYNGGAWSGTAGITSTTARNSSASDGIGYGLGLQLGRGTFNGISINGNDVLLDHTLYGDADLDHAVNLIDFNRVATNFGAANRTSLQGDFNYDAMTNLVDYNLLAANFGQFFGALATGPNWRPANAANRQRWQMELLA